MKEINISLDAIDPPSWPLTDENKEKTDKYISEQISGMCVCSSLLKRCKGVEPYNEDYLICPLCDSTYNIGKE